MVHASLDSTMREARRLADAGETGPLWVQALEQTAGKGRRGRAWHGLAGNVFLTGLVTLQATPQEAANLSFAAALAVAQTADACVDPALVRVKWPNDVLIGGRKTSGILLESWPGPAAGLLTLLIGIGLNVAAAPGDASVESPATCLARHLEPGAALPTAEQAGVLLAGHMEHWIARWQDHGFAPVRAAWTARAAGLDGPVTARLQDRDIHGTLRGISDTGCLLLEGEGGFTHQIAAADIFIPQATQGTV
jgi:BirA family transcriptional regulator, biotin operon repressor / biotin---[acetyl-CoA-carboxylase] ligase